MYKHVHTRLHISRYVYTMYVSGRTRALSEHVIYMMSACVGRFTTARRRVRWPGVTVTAGFQMAAYAAAASQDSAARRARGNPNANNVTFLSPANRHGRGGASLHRGLGFQVCLGCHVSPPFSTELPLPKFDKIGEKDEITAQSAHKAGYLGEKG
jgi:hypothetical protein